MKNEKIEKLKSILLNAKPVVTENELAISYSFGFRPEVYIKSTAEENEIEFNNIDEAVSVIKESRPIVNRTENQIKEDLLTLCSASSINPNDKFVIRFLTT